MKQEKNKKYTKQLRIWLTEEQHKKIVEDRELLGIKTSALARKLLDKEYVYGKYLSNLILEVKKEGNNLNQIARHCNETDQAGEEIIEYLAKIEKRLSELGCEVKKLK